MERFARQRGRHHRAAFWAVVGAFMIALSLLGVGAAAYKHLRDERAAHYDNGSPAGSGHLRRRAGMLVPAAAAGGGDDDDDGDGLRERGASAGWQPAMPIAPQGGGQRPYYGPVAAGLPLLVVPADVADRPRRR